MSKDIPRLDAGLIMRKGEAVPTGSIPPIPGAKNTPTSATAPVSEHPAVSARRIKPGVATPKGLAGTIAVTVRLDPARYEEMKIHGARQRLTNQEILVAALDAYLMEQAAK